MANLTVMYGSQTFSNSSAKIHTFVMQRDGTDRREFPDKQLMAQKAGGSSNKFLAAINGVADHGVWYRKTYEAKNGVVMALSAKTTRNSAPYNNGVMFIALRDTGPLINVNVAICPNRNAVYESILVFQGNGDVLSDEDLENYGIVLPRTVARNTRNAEELEELFTVTTLSPGEARPQTIEVRESNGKVRKVQIIPEKSRRIRIRSI